MATRDITTDVENALDDAVVEPFFAVELCLTARHFVCGLEQVMRRLTETVMSEQAIC